MCCLLAKSFTVFGPGNLKNCISKIDGNWNNQFIIDLKGKFLQMLLHYKDPMHYCHESWRLKFVILGNPCINSTILQGRVNPLPPVHLSSMEKYPHKIILLIEVSYLEIYLKQCLSCMNHLSQCLIFMFIGFFYISKMLFNVATRCTPALLQIYKT